MIYEGLYYLGVALLVGIIVFGILFIAASILTGIIALVGSIILRRWWKPPWADELAEMINEFS